METKVNKQKVLISLTFQLDEKFPIIIPLIDNIAVVTEVGIIIHIEVKREFIV